MSSGFDREALSMSKAERLAWLHCVALTAAGAYLFWLGWTSWPDAAALARNADRFGISPIWIAILVVGGQRVIERRNPDAPLADEREQAINHAALKNAFAALALMVVMLTVVVRIDAWRAQVTPEWITLALALMLVASFLLNAVYRLVRYRPD